MSFINIMKKIKIKNYKFILTLIIFLSLLLICIGLAIIILFKKYKFKLDIYGDRKQSIPMTNIGGTNNCDPNLEYDPKYCTSGKYILPGFRGGYRQLVENGKLDEQNGIPGVGSLVSLHNTTNFDRITRQMKVFWPEFNWSNKGDNMYPRWDGTPRQIKNNIRIHKMFAKDISRVAYDDTGKIYNIICPQVGSVIQNVGIFNLEVTVTEVKGWIDETELDKVDGKWIDGYIVVKGKVWISHPHKSLKFIMDACESIGMDFPSSKSNAIVINTYDPVTNKKELRITPGYSPYIGEIPDFTKHELVNNQPIREQARNVCYLTAMAHEFEKGHSISYNNICQIIMELYWLGSNNVMKPGSGLTWNINAAGPFPVDINEYTEHNSYWRKSLENSMAFTQPQSDDRVLINGKEMIFNDEIQNEKRIKYYLSDIVPNQIENIIQYFEKEKHYQIHKHALNMIRYGDKIANEIIINSDNEKLKDLCRNHLCGVGKHQISCGECKL